MQIILAEFVIGQILRADKRQKNSAAKCARERINRALARSCRHVRGPIIRIRCRDQGGASSDLVGGGAGGGEGRVEGRKERELDSKFRKKKRRNIESRISRSRRPCASVIVDDRDAIMIKGSRFSARREKVNGR